MDKSHKGHTFIIAIGITLAILLMVGSVGAVPVEEWNKTYGGSSNDDAWSFQQTTDGGYIIAGHENSFGNGGAWIIKTDANGIEAWNKTLDYWTGYGNVPDSNSAKSVRQTSDGGFVMTGMGSTAAGSSTQEYGFIIKTDGNGNVQCRNKLGNQFGNSIQQTTDGGYIITGDFMGDILLLKVNSGCVQEWRKNFGDWMPEGGKSVQQTSDGGYIIAGAKASGATDALLVKTDSNGNQQWIKTYGGTKADIAKSVQETTDGGYILGGQTSSYSNLYTRAWLLKTDANGVEQWNKTHGGAYDEEDYIAQQTSDGGYALAGVTRSSNGQKRRASLIKTDANGNYLWNMSFGGVSDDYAYSFQQTSDGGYALAGRTSSYGINHEAGRSDAWLIKVSADDTTSPTSNIELSGTLGNNNWYTSDVQITLTASDNEGGSGIANTEYSLDNGINWIQYSNPFTISNEGTTTISYRSIDVAGDIEQTKNQMIQIDKTAPSISGAATTSPNANNWYKNDVTIKFTASDAGSGIDTVTPDTIISTEAASQSVSGTAIDKAGNSASTTVSGINIDKTIPSITISSPEAKDYLQSGSITLNFNVLDTISGIDSTISYLDSNTVINGEVIDLSTLTLGQHTLTVNAIDKAGNTETKSVIFNILNKGAEQIPEFPTVALPVIAVIGLMFLFQRRKGE